MLKFVWVWCTLLAYCPEISKSVFPRWMKLLRRGFRTIEFPLEDLFLGRSGEIRESLS